jgi:hypothetical protein
MTDNATTPTTEPTTPPVAIDPRAVPYSRFKQVNDELKSLKAAQATAQTDERVALERQLADARAETVSLQRQMLTRDILDEMDLPRAVMDVLRLGDDADTIRANAQAVRRFLRGGTGTVPRPAFTPGDVADPAWYAQHRAGIQAALKQSQR